MPAIIRQQFNNPITGNTEVAEMEVDIEMVQKDDLDSISSELLLRINPWGHPGQPFRKEFKPVYLNPSELISKALDSRRTTNTKGCVRTRLYEKAKKGDCQITIADPELLKIKQGDVIAILSDLKNGPKAFAYVNKVLDNILEIHCGNEGLPCDFFKGAIVENLADRWHKFTKTLGAKSQLKRPSPMPIYLKPSRMNDGILVIMQTPISMGILKACDVYVRKEKFSEIEPHWIPDAQDIDVEEDSVMVKTYGGGFDAGGGHIEKGTYYVGLVTKDNIGFCNVNESEPSIADITLN